MNEIDRLEYAFREAHKAGKKEHAAAFAARIRELQSEDLPPDLPAPAEVIPGGGPAGAGRSGMLARSQSTPVREETGRGNILDQALQGATANFSDEIMGGLGSTYANFVDMLTDKSGVTGKGYEGINAGEGTRLARADLDEFAERNPMTAGAGQIAGAIATSGPFALRAFASPAIKNLPKAARLPVVAGGEGFVHGVGAGEEGFDDRLTEGLKQGGTSAVMGPLANYGINKIMKGLSRRKSIGEQRPGSDASDLLEHELELAKLSPMHRSGDTDESTATTFTRLVKNSDTAEVLGERTVSDLKDIIIGGKGKRTARNIAGVDPGKGTARSGIPVAVGFLTQMMTQDPKLALAAGGTAATVILAGKISKMIANRMTKKETDLLLDKIGGTNDQKASAYFGELMDKYGAGIEAGSAGAAAGISPEDYKAFKDTLVRGVQGTSLSDIMP